MSSLKKDIEGVLDNLAVKAIDKYVLSGGMGELVKMEVAREITKANKQILNLIESVIGDMEHRETEDMGLKSWTPEDYKAFGRNELRADIKSKLIREE